MGWTSYDARNWKNGKIDIKAEIDEMWNERNNGRTQVLKSCVKSRTYYGAIKDNVSGEVFAVVYLTSTNCSDGFNFAYKDMDETMNPYQHDCPKSILDLLTPTNNEYAKEWRKTCYENLELKKSSNSLSKLPIGTKIKFILPFDTTYNSKGSEIILEKKKNFRTNRSYWGQSWCKWTSALVKNVEKNCKYEILE